MSAISKSDFFSKDAVAKRIRFFQNIAGFFFGTVLTYRDQNATFFPECEVFLDI